MIPSVSVTWISSVASTPYLCGFEPFIESDECVRYRTKTISGEFIDPALGSCEYSRKYTYSGAAAYGAGSCSLTSYALFNSWRQDDPDCETVPIVVDGQVTQIGNASVDVASPPCAAGKQTTGTATSATVFTVTGCDFTGSGTETLSDPDTVADAIARASGVSYDTQSCAYTGAASGCSFAQSQSSTGTFTVTGSPSTSYTIRIFTVSYPTDDSTTKILDFEDVTVTTDSEGSAEFEYQLPDPAAEHTVCFAGATPLTYQFRFKIPLSGCYGLSWIERVVSPDGESLTSVEVLSPGVYRPIITIDAPPIGGSQATAVAVMNSSGGVSSIRVTNPGFGYDPHDPPEVTVATAINGGTSSTGWTATLKQGKVSSITGGNSGNYLPTVSITDSEISVQMDEQGGIESITVVTSGTDYIASPSVSVTSKVASYTNAVFRPHLGTETAKTFTWDRVTPSGYDKNDPLTWPTTSTYSFTPDDATIFSIEYVTQNCRCGA